jgi:hypothetical protein
MRVITELEKTIMIAFAVVGRGEDIFIPEEAIILRFSTRQRKIIGRFIKKLAADRFLEKRYNNYKLSDLGKKYVARLLSEGASLWMPKK